MGGCDVKSATPKAATAKAHTLCHHFAHPTPSPGTWPSAGNARVTRLSSMNNVCHAVYNCGQRHVLGHNSIDASSMD